VELKTAITSGKKSTGLLDPQEDPRVGIREASKWDVQQVSENEEMDLLERLAPMKMKKEIMFGVRAGYMGALATPGGREREKRKLLDDGDKPD
jgi:hypothetical protein